MKTYQDPETADVRAFHEKLGFLISDRPAHLTDRKMVERLNFIREEFEELCEAHDFGQMAKMLDAMIDMVYVIKGTALMMGLPWEEAWSEVQRANLEKVPGVTHRGNKVDAVKPEGWRPPDHDSILALYGYAADDWLEPAGDMGERYLKPGLGVDDPGQAAVPVVVCEGGQHVLVHAPGQTWEGNAPARVAGTPTVRPQCQAMCPADAPYGVTRMACRLPPGHDGDHVGAWPSCRTGDWEVARG